MIQIPDRLAELLRRDRTLDAAVKASLDEFEPWLEAGGKRPTFFPDYTDHSVQHIQEVLETTVSLIRDEAWPALTPGDAAVLVLSTLLHDSAMHLTREGFEALVRLGKRWTPIDGFDDRPWPQLWADFCLEARRFDQRRLVDLFGDAEPVQIPDLDNLELDPRARRLIGEFVRRHHPRLAHEIARYGAPGPTDDPLRIRGNDEIVDLAGLVARSHGLSARACLPYLKQQFGSRTDPLGVHAVFLIALLRIADYLQLHAGRAPERTLKVHKIRSPYSAVEWKLHASVKDIGRHEEDAEAVYIRAKPEDVETYLRLKSWLCGLQAEIDASWAVLGEVYSRQAEGMDKLGVKVRRIHSNLDDEANFSRSVYYLPRRVAFTAAGGDLLKLLIGPLYGGRPEMGIRELIQNAVDAVRELNNLYERGLVPSEIDFADQESDVVARLEQTDDHWWFTVSDRGVGMTPDVLCNYFLRAGASFRNSDAWRQRFSDDENRSQVLRSGRFGVGALAAFLLGDRLEVTTRHVEAPVEQGLSFVAELHTDPIEVVSVRRPVGTTIRIRLNASAIESLVYDEIGHITPQKNVLAWDWYCLRKPNVVRILDSGSPPLPQRYLLPDPQDPLPDGWRKFRCDGYQEIHWTYRNAPRLTVNGIIIRGARIAEHYPETCGLSIRVPNVSIFDPDGSLPLTLRRDGLAASEYPFDEALLSEVIKDYIGAALLSAPHNPPTSGQRAKWYAGYMHSGLFEITPYMRWASTGSGALPLQALICWEVGLQRVLLQPMLISEKKERGKPERTVRDKRAVTAFMPQISAPAGSASAIVPIHLKEVYGKEALISLVNNTQCYNSVNFLHIMKSFLFNSFATLSAYWHPSSDHHPLQPLIDSYTVRGVNIVVPRSLEREFDKALPHDFDKMPVYRRRTIASTTWYCGADADPQLFSQSYLHSIGMAQKISSMLPIVEWVLERRPVPPSGNTFVTLWKAIVGANEIPHDPVLRRKRLATAFELLKTYIEPREQARKQRSEEFPRR